MISEGTSRICTAQSSVGWILSYCVVIIDCGTEDLGTSMHAHVHVCVRVCAFVCARVCKRNRNLIATDVKGGQIIQIAQVDR